MGIVGFPRVRSRIDRKVNVFLRDQAIHGNLGSPLWFTQSHSAIFFSHAIFGFLVKPVLSMLNDRVFNQQPFDIKTHITT